MKYVPVSLTRFAHRSMLKVSKHSPTILVVGGVVGFGATAVMAVRASKQDGPVLASHRQRRRAIDMTTYDRRSDRGRETLALYANTATGLARIYGPTVVVGTLSAAAILGGHNILNRRHVATMAAYSGLMDQLTSYRERVAKTLGEAAEKDIYEGARGEYVEDPNRKGEYKLQPNWDEVPEAVTRPWFDENNAHWSPNPQTSLIFLEAVQSHMNSNLYHRGHVFVNDVFDALHMERTPEGAVLGWLRDSKTGDGVVDLGILTSRDPNTVAFRKGETRNVQLNLNYDGVIWDSI